MANKNEGELLWDVQLTVGEVRALKKAILYLKFSCKESESLLFCGSPFINNAFDKLVAVDDLGAAEKDFFSKRHKANEDFVLNKINQEELFNEKELENSIKIELYKSCLHPFPFKG